MRGSQKRALYKPYSIATAVICACIGEIIGFTHFGMSSSECGSSSFTISHTSSGVAKR